MYDSRLGRWFAVDPMFINFPWQSPYVAFDNNPIYIIDANGEAGKAYWQNVEILEYTYNGNNSHTITQTTYRTKIIYERDSKRTVTQIKVTRKIIVTVSKENGL